MASILVVEDTADILDILTRQLRHAGHDVIGAMNGIEGIACARTHMPDLIVMDLVMPMLNGWEAIKQLKADARCADLPILAISARALTETMEQARAAGCDAFMSKPFTMQELFTVIDSLIEVATEMAS
jgi:two-component system, cell cycle response regulator DivK